VIGVVAETTKHIFHDYQIATFTWRVIQLALTYLSLPKNSNDMFGDWLCSFNKNERNLITIGCSAILWSMWKIRNNYCFSIVFGWILGPFSRKNQQEGPWRKEAP
jgi:hypothetical protein